MVAFHWGVFLFRWLENAPAAVLLKTPQADSLADLRVWADFKSRAAHSVINYSLPVKAIELLNDWIHYLFLSKTLYKEHLI